MNKFNTTLRRVDPGVRDRKNSDYTYVELPKKNSIKIICLNHTPHKENF